jgi:hypothetical protein
MRSGSIMLANVAKQTDELAIACSKCDRTGRYRPQTLIRRYGPQFAISDLLGTLSVGCPMRESGSGAGGIASREPDSALFAA